jgi:hypothetical protein
LERRSFSLVWGQFGELYEAAKRSDEPVLETLSRTTVERLAKLHARGEFKEEEFNEFLSTLLKNLSLDNNITVQITSRYKYDLVVDSSKQSSAACAEQILEFMKQGREYTALQENYEVLTREPPQRTLWQRFWDWVFCRGK